MLLLVGSGRALGTVWRLPPGATLSVGRKGAPLLIEHDHSVSRAHASISAGADDSTGISIVDNGSKFGVHVNGRRCPANTRCPVGAADRVTFGAQDSTFRLYRCPVSICIANIHSDDTAPLVDTVRARAAALGIPIAANVEQCSHLLVAKLAVTSTLVRALVLGRRIVSPGFVQALESLPLAFKVDAPSDERADEFVRAMQFLPEAGPPDPPADSPIDLRGIDWAPDGRRQRLFRGKLFVFADTAQHDRYRALVGAAGGASAGLAGVDQWLSTPERTEPLLCAQSTASAERMLALAKEMGVGTELAPGEPVLHLVLPPPPSPEGGATELGPAALVRATAAALDVRPMSESEISLAVLFVSCEHHANAALRNEDSAGTDGHSSTDAAVPGQSRARKRARISSFWETAVAGDATHGPPAVPVEGAQQPARRKRRIGDFWTDAIQDDVQDTAQGAAQSTAPDAPPTAKAADASTAKDGPPASTALGPQPADVTPADVTPADEQPEATVVPLVKPRTSRVLRAPDCSAAPNFKQFRKTVHPYQVEHR